MSMVFLLAAVEVLLGGDASLSQRTAAEELSDYCGKMGIRSGTIELKTDESLGENGYTLETVGGRLVISGSKARGVLNGAYGYLQDMCGVEWFSSWCEEVPNRERLPLPAAKETHKPAFEVRCSFWHDIMTHPRLGARLRMNSNIWYPRDDRFGPDCHKVDPLFEFAHSTNRILPAKELFNDHPEWFSEIGGKRISDLAQPCLTNEEVFEFVKARLLERIKADPETEFYGFELGDYYNDCTCAKCKAVNEREGTSGGTYWQFVNRLAAVLKEHAPHAYIKTTVYQQTSTPPKTIRLAGNVIVDWAPIEAVRDEPLVTATHPRSTGCMRELRGFQAIYGGKFIVWDYTTDFAEYCLPFANLPVLQPNLRLFREIGTYYMFEQGNHNGWHGDFDEMKGWLLAQWMWNPDLDAKSLYRRFVPGYYGKLAAPYVYQYIKLLQDTIRESPKTNAIGIWNLPHHRPEYFDDAFLSKAAELWDAAEAAVKDDPAKSYNVRMGAIPIRYLQCLKYAKTVNLTSDSGALERGRAYAKKFVALLDEAAAAGHPVAFGETDHTPLLKRIREFAGGAPVIGDGNAARLGSTAFLTTSWGTVCRHEKSEEGYDGDLIHLFNNDYGWFPSATLDMVAFDPDTEYTLRIRAKVKATGKDGELFSAGVYDTSVQKEYACHVYPKDLKNGGDWAWYDVATWKPGVGHMSYLYAAAGFFDKKKYELSPAHEGVWIDGFEIVRKDGKGSR